MTMFCIHSLIKITLPWRMTVSIALSYWIKQATHMKLSWCLNVIWHSHFHLYMFKNTNEEKLLTWSTRDRSVEVIFVWWIPLHSLMMALPFHVGWELDKHCPCVHAADKRERKVKNKITVYMFWVVYTAAYIQRYQILV